MTANSSEENTDDRAFVFARGDSRWKLGLLLWGTNPTTAEGARSRRDDTIMVKLEDMLVFYYLL